MEICLPTLQGWMGWQLPHGPSQPGYHLHHHYFHRYNHFDDAYDDVDDDVDDDDGDVDDDVHQVAQANDYSLSREVTNHLFQGLPILVANSNKDKDFNIWNF